MKFFFDKKIVARKPAYLVRGFTLLEMLIVLAILGIIIVAIVEFQVKVLKNNKISADNLTTAQDARIIVRTITKELRTASTASNGSFAIANAGTSTITFFSDYDSDGLKEQIRYFVSGGILKKGVIEPVGNPLSYSPANENLSTLAYNISNATNTPIFEYFDTNYAGTTTPLTYPMDLQKIRLVKVTLFLNSSKTYTSQVSLRNLKDNI